MPSLDETARQVDEHTSKAALRIRYLRQVTEAASRGDYTAEELQDAATRALNDREPFPKDA